MYFLLSGVLLMCLLCGRPGLVAELPRDGAYVSRERTCMINGIFIWIVFMSHMQGYQSLATAWDRPVLEVIGRMGQTMVATFLFFSDYGIMASLQRKGILYSKQLITHRFCKVLLHFAVAVALFWGIQYAMGIRYDAVRVLSSFYAWSSIGNSNWFIFITLAAYLIIALNNMLLRRWGGAVVAGGVALSFLMLIPLLLRKGDYWVDSCLCIPAGMFFCLYRERVEEKVRACRCPVWLLGAVLSFAGVMLYRGLALQVTLRTIGEVPLLVLVLVRNVGCIVFALGVCFFFAGVRFARVPAFLVWSGGAALFYLYIFQRIPMLVGKHGGIHVAYPLAYQVGCAICSLVIAWVACRIFPRMDALIWHREKEDARGANRT